MVLDEIDRKDREMAHEKTSEDFYSGYPARITITNELDFFFLYGKQGNVKHGLIILFMILSLNIF